MNERAKPRVILAVSAVLLGGAILASMFLGGQVRPILSTVGSSVGGGQVRGAPLDTPAGGPAATAAPTPGTKVAALGALPPPTLLIVRTGLIDLEVTDVDAAIRAADAAVARAGGYVDGSRRDAANDEVATTVAYRIPSATWPTALEAIRRLAAKIRSEQITSEEVSGQVVDLGARIANLRSTEAALQAIMGKASAIKDVLEVQKELTATRGEIERLVADKSHLEDRAAFGSLTVTFSPPPRPAPSALPSQAPAWDPGGDAARATTQLVTIGQASTSVGIWLAIVGLPLLVGGLVVLLVGWQVVRLGRWLVDRRWMAGGQTG